MSLYVNLKKKYWVVGPVLTLECSSQGLDDPGSKGMPSPMHHFSYRHWALPSLQAPEQALHGGPATGAQRQQALHFGEYDYSYARENTKFRYYTNMA